jgi:hypothetical protein
MNITIVNGRYVECCEENCPFNRECSTHFSAGDFRTEDGFKPLIIKKAEGLHCKSKRSERSEPQNNWSEPIINNGSGLCLASDVQNEESNYQI